MFLKTLFNKKTKPLRGGNLENSEVEAPKVEKGSGPTPLNENEVLDRMEQEENELPNGQNGEFDDQNLNLDDADEEAAFLAYQAKLGAALGIDVETGMPKATAPKRAEGEEDPFAKVKAEKIAAVVTIELTYPRTFGLNSAGSSSATGFVVDAEKGLILTNKHVVKVGPVRAKARFFKHEEIDLTPVYRDPVHDYGFFRFNPEELKETPKQEIELDPEGATKGRNCLVIGNNAGERLSFIETTIARTDRPYVPMLDLNTFLINSSDTGVGGSSGSPLLTKEGKAVAIVSAGDSWNNISMYLPLFRIVRALEYLRKGEEPPRGTLQVGYKHKTFQELTKKGAITEDVVAKMKEAHADAEGMLVVEKNLPKGPGREAGIKNGDVLMKMNGHLLHNFVQMEETVDTFVGKDITLTVMREKQEIELKARAQDLAMISPREFVEVSNGIFHNLEYLIAIEFNLPLEGVFLAQNGHMFSNVEYGAIIKKVGATETPTLESFINALGALPNGKLVSVKYQPIQDPTKTELRTVVVDKRWYPFELARRDDVKGKWDYENLLEKLANSIVHDRKKTFVASGEKTGEATESSFCDALVAVKFMIPFTIDGAYSFSQTCTGIVVDKEIGLILTSRDAVSTTLGDVLITFSQTKTIPGKVIYLDPKLPYTFVTYDPELLKGSEEELVSVREVQLSDERPRPGEKLLYYGVNGQFENEELEVKIKNIRDIDLFGGEPMGFSATPLPQESVNFSEGVQTGVFMSKEENPRAKVISLSTMWGTPALAACDALPLVQRMRDSLKGGAPIPATIDCLPITTAFISLSEARNSRGLNDEWAKRLKKTMSKQQRNLIVVKRRMVDSDSYYKLVENDIVLAVDGQPVTKLRDFNAATTGKNEMTLTLLRDNEVIEQTVSSRSFSTVGTTRLLRFAGLILQMPHPAVYYLSKPEFLTGGGVYVNFCQQGSPAESSMAEERDYSSTGSIVEKILYKVDGKEIKDLDELLEALKGKKHNEFVRLTARNTQHGEESVHDIRLDLEYWKTRDMHLGEDKEWHSRIIEH